MEVIKDLLTLDMCDYILASFLAYGLIAGYIFIVFVISYCIVKILLGVNKNEEKMRRDNKTNEDNTSV